MNISIDEITFIVVTHQSEQVIYNCLSSLPKNSKKIIIENSQSLKLKGSLEDNYDNIEVFMTENIGMGGSNNIGINKSKTKYVYILNPDVIFKKDTISNLLKSLEKIDDFAIITPLNSNTEYPNFKIKQKKQDPSNMDIISVDTIDGFSMLINKSKYQDNIFFDENFFLYLENDDLCLRTKKKGEKIYVITKSVIDHSGGIGKNDATEQLRNWHWMWSKFYFNKKHNGFLIAFLDILLNFIPAIFKYFFYLLIFNSHKQKIYLMRILGIYNSILGKRSWYRPNVKS